MRYLLKRGFSRIPELMQYKVITRGHDSPKPYSMQSDWSGLAFAGIYSRMSDHSCGWFVYPDKSKGPQIPFISSAAFNEGFSISAVTIRSLGKKLRLKIMPVIVKHELTIPAIFKQSI